MSDFNSHGIDIFYQTIGWIAFAAWSISFYPQVILNYRRKSVVGLSFDFLYLNILKHSSYGLANFLNYFSPVVKSQSAEYYGNADQSVALSDVAFSAHAITLTLITIGQTFIYDRGGQTVSIPGRIVIGLALLWILVNLIISAANPGFLHIPNWLWFALAMNGLQIFLSCCKYSPQVYMNWKRKSTTGWSIHNILLDITGGLLSLLQVILIYADHDSTVFAKNWGKTCLGMLTIVYDSIFIFQHYYLYTDRREYKSLNFVAEDEYHRP